MATANEETMRLYGTAWTEGDYAGMQSLMDDDVVLHLFGHSPVAGTFRGKKELADIVLLVPSDDTARIQEIHLAVEHVICEMVEERLRG